MRVWKTLGLHGLQACELILFTQDEAVLEVCPFPSEIKCLLGEPCLAEAVAEHDWLPAHLPVDSDEEPIWFTWSDLERLYCPACL